MELPRKRTSIKSRWVFVALCRTIYSEKEEKKKLVTPRHCPIKIKIRKSNLQNFSTCLISFHIRQLLFSAKYFKEETEQGFRLVVSK